MHRVRARSPRTGLEHDFFGIECADWVNVIPFTPHGEVVMVRQYRHGADRVTLEVPGGIVDPGETPAQAAARELLEETGYRAGRIEPLGEVEPNPAFLANRCHTFLATELERIGDPEGDGEEELEVVIERLEDLPRRVASGEIRHALVVAALYLHDLAGRP